jgi:pimeloyl-ACP methyl ester carboxylesterase
MPQDFTDFQQAYARLSPHPDHFDDFLATLSTSSADTQGWPDDELAAITAPTLLVIGDHDFTTVEHAALMQQLSPAPSWPCCPAPPICRSPGAPTSCCPYLHDFSTEPDPAPVVSR